MQAAPRSVNTECTQAPRQPTVVRRQLRHHDRAAAAALRVLTGVQRRHGRVLPEKGEKVAQRRRHQLAQLQALQRGDAPARRACIMRVRVWDCVRVHGQQRTGQQSWPAVPPLATMTRDCSAKHACSSSERALATSPHHTTAHSTRRHPAVSLHCTSSPEVGVGVAVDGHWRQLAKDVQAARQPVAPQLPLDLLGRRLLVLP